MTNGFIQEKETLDEWFLSFREMKKLFFFLLNKWFSGTNFKKMIFFSWMNLILLNFTEQTIILNNQWKKERNRLKWALFSFNVQFFLEWSKQEKLQRYVIINVAMPIVIHF